MKITKLTLAVISILTFIGCSKSRYPNGRVVLPAGEKATVEYLYGTPREAQSAEDNELLNLSKKEALDDVSLSKVKELLGCVTESKASTEEEKSEETSEEKTPEETLTCSSKNAKANVNAFDIEMRNTALINAVKNENLALVEVLLAAQANLTFENRAGQSAFSIVEDLTSPAQPELKKLLDTSMVAAISELQKAIQEGNATEVKRLDVVRGLDMTMTLEGETPETTGTVLEVALKSSKGAPVVTYLLAQEGVDSEKRALVLLANSDSRPMLKAVLDTKSYDVNAIDEEGNTPLHVFAKANNMVGVVTLLEYGADAAAKNKDGQTPSEVTTDDEVRTVLEKATETTAE